MKHLQGKKVQIVSNGGVSYIGIVTGSTDDIVKILCENQTDETVIFIKNIFSYKIIGQGVSGGFSGIQVFACKNENIGCKGKIYLSKKKSTTIQNMNCEICKAKTVAGIGFKCDFGTLGDLQVLPSKVQGVLFQGLIKDNNIKKQ